MIAFLKLLALAIVAQFAAVGAFVPRAGSHSTAYRSVQQQVQPSTTQCYMATATPVAPAPVKKKEKKVTNENDNQSDDEKDKGWLVRLYNDPMNKREFVAMCLMEVCGLDDGASYSIMMRAHQAGIAVIGNYHRELAEMYKMRLTEEGLFVDMIPADDDE